MVELLIRTRVKAIRMILTDFLRTFMNYKPTGRVEEQEIRKYTTGYTEQDYPFPIFFKILYKGHNLLANG